MGKCWYALLCSHGVVPLVSRRTWSLHTLAAVSLAGLSISGRTESYAAVSLPGLNISGRTEYLWQD